VADHEQDWIAKYRAALSVIPATQPWSEKLVARLKARIQKLISSIRKAAYSRTTAASFEKLLDEPSCPKIARVAISAGNPQPGSDGSSTQTPDNPHLLDRYGRRRAS